ncbi:MAG: metal-dependent hydrolase [Opitutales bacterium]|jgi:inner membrane protein
MDPLTHAVLGISAGLVLRPKETPVAAAATAGLLAGMAPDLDVFIRSPGDPLVSFRWHRHFTHSFAFMPVIATATALFTAWCFRRREGAGWKALWLPALGAVLTHLLCDACTSYGTMLLWPFTPARIAWDCLPIIDVTCTLPVLGLAAFAWRRGSRRAAAFGLAWFTAYAGLGVMQHARAETAVRGWLESRGVRPERLAVKPTFSNLLVWRAVWLHGGRWEAAGVRVAPWSAPEIAPGDSRRAYSPEGPDAPPAGSRGAKMVAEFSEFTGGWNSVDRRDGEVFVGDIRFATLPTSARPLWSVRLPPDGSTADVFFDRRIEDGDWGRFGSLLTGSDPRYVRTR